MNVTIETRCAECSAVQSETTLFGVFEVMVGRELTDGNKKGIPMDDNNTISLNIILWTHIRCKKCPALDL